jgi:hypothetical protein
MKKITQLIVITFLIFQSCSSGDDKTDGSIQNSSKVTGKWEYFQIGVFSPKTIITGNESLSNYQQSCSNKKDYIEFLSEGVCKGVYYYDCKELVIKGTWDKTDAILNANFDNEGKVPHEILDLTSTTLKLKSTNYSDKGIPYEIVVLSFKKI